MSEEPTTGKIANFYKVHDPTLERASRSNGKLSHALNFGFWTEDVGTLYLAQRRLMKEVAETSPPGEWENVGDIGCGKGSFGIFLSDQYGANVMGIDILFDHIKEARSAAQNAQHRGSVNLLVADSQRLPVPPEKMDKLFCLESAFHYPDKEKFAREAYRVLKKGGSLVIADITCEDNRHLRFDDVTFTSTGNWKKILKEAGFSVTETRGIGGHVYPGLFNFSQSINPREYPDPRAALWWKMVIRDYFRNFNEGNMNYVIFRNVK